MNFEGEFAPAGSISVESAPPYRQEMSMNGRWQFQAVAVPPGWVAGVGNAPFLSDPKPDGWDQIPIKIPSPWNVNSYGEADCGEFRTFPNYPKYWETVDMAWLRREFYNMPDTEWPSSLYRRTVANAQFPLHRLPVLEECDGYYWKADFTLVAGEVLHDCLG